MSALRLSRSRKPKQGGSGSLPRILVVDDDVESADSLAAALQSAGYGEARVAYSGATALTLAGAFLPTVLLVDLDLPDMSGHDVARLLSQHPKLPNLRMIALTASSEHPGRELARVELRVRGGRHHEHRTATRGGGIAAEHLPRLGGVGRTEDQSQGHAAYGGGSPRRHLDIIFNR